MRILPTLIGVSALVAATPNAYAASAMFSCFETEAAADQFVANVKMHESSYHESEKKRRELLGTQGQSYNSLLYILGDSPNVSFRDLKSDQAAAQSIISQYTFHKHLMPTDVKPNDQGQYCSKTWSEGHMYYDIWTVDTKKNIVLTSKFQTEITR